QANRKASIAYYGRSQEVGPIDPRLGCKQVGNNMAGARKREARRRIGTLQHGGTGVGAPRRQNASAAVQTARLFNRQQNSGRSFIRSLGCSIPVATKRLAVLNTFVPSSLAYLKSSNFRGAPKILSRW